MLGPGEGQHTTSPLHAPGLRNKTQPARQPNPGTSPAAAGYLHISEKMPILRLTTSTVMLR